MGHPFDTVKVRLQSQSAAYHTSLQCVRSIIREEGVSVCPFWKKRLIGSQVRGLFKGLAAPIYSIAFTNAVLFATYDSTLRILSQSYGVENPRKMATVPQLFAAGAIAGSLTALVNSPFELAKVVMQNQSPYRSTILGSRSSSYTGSLNCMIKTYEMGGMRGLFRGLNCTLLRDAPATGVYFTVYEGLCRMGRADSNYPLSTVHHLMAGGTAGVLSWSVTYPLDVIKTQLQSQGGQSRDRKTGPSSHFRGTLDCARYIVRQQGYRAFTRGLPTTLLRAFPTNASTFLVYEWASRLMRIN